MLDEPIPVLEGAVECAECRRPGPAGSPGWELLQIEENPAEFRWFCPRCVERQFSDD